jgi:ERCC4-type nuclease
LTDGPTIIVDTREQSPYAYTRMVVKTLKTGDYSVEGLENEVCCERKSLTDLYGTVGAGRERFVRELERMAGMVRACIVVEASLHTILYNPPERSMMSPRSVVGSLVSWSARYNIPIFFAGDRTHGQALTLKFLTKYHQYKIEGKLFPTKSPTAKESHHE